MAEVNYIRHWNEVNLKFSQEDRGLFKAHHIALYNALFQIWNGCNFQDELSINRQEMMHLSRIGNASTYINALKLLDKLGYIKYKPSHNPMIGSIVSLYVFGTSSDTTSAIGSGASGGSTTDPTGDPTGAPLYKLSKQLNNKTIKQLNTHVELVNENLSDWIKIHKSLYPETKLEILPNENPPGGNKKRKKVPAKKEKDIPSLEEFTAYALDKKPTLCEGGIKSKYDAWIENGWKNGRNVDIINWKSNLNNTIPYILEKSSNEKPSFSQKVMGQNKYDVFMAKVEADKLLNPEGNESKKLN